QPPAIEANYLSDRDDLDVLVRGFDIARGLFATRPLVDHVAAETLPGPDVTGAALEQYVRDKGVTIYHPTGTCRMAPGGVVDPRLRVHGIEGLRVADASIMPNITSGNTNAAAMMIGEKAAAMIAE